MRFTAQVGDDRRHAEITRKGDGWLVASVDGRRYELSLTEPQPLVFSILHEGVSHEAIVEMRKGRCRVRLDGRVVEVIPEEGVRTGRATGRRGEAAIRAVMPGRVLRVMVEKGQRVEFRHGLLVLEAMKMENEVIAPREGTIRRIHVKPGQTVETGDILLMIE